MLRLSLPSIAKIARAIVAAGANGRPDGHGVRSVLTWAGRSKIDGSAIGAFLTLSSKNEKTGDMPAIAMLALDRHPVEAVQDHKDRGLCGTCFHLGFRAVGKRLKRIAKRSCYVAIAHGPASVYKAWKRGNVPSWTYDQVAEVLRDRAVRLGSYADPGGVPVEVWNYITRYARRVIGYTQRWRFGVMLQHLCMASVMSPAERLEAKALGYRTFRTGDPGTLPEVGEIYCPATVEGGSKTHCVTCCLCDGNQESRTGKIDRRADVLAIVHGSGKKYFSLSAVN